MGKITDLLRTSEFQAGLVDGILALAFVLLCTTPRIFGRRPAIAGGAFAVAGLAVLTGTGPGEHALAAVGFAACGGVVLLLVGGVLTRVLPRPMRMLAAPLLLLPGSAVLAVAAHSHGAPAWAALILLLGFPVVAAFGSDFDAYHRRRALGPLMLAITVGGVYLTVPDTEGAREALLGVALPFVLLTVPRPLATLGAGGSAAALGLVWYDATIEGAARPGSIIGALGCVGVLLYEPIGRRVLVLMREREHKGYGPSDHVRVVAIACAMQATLVLWASRVAGRPHSALTALVVLLPAVAGGIVAAPLLPDPPRPRRARPRQAS